MSRNERTYPATWSIPAFILCRDHPFRDAWSPTCILVRGSADQPPFLTADTPEWPPNARTWSAGPQYTGRPSLSSSRSSNMAKMEERGWWMEHTTVWPWEARDLSVDMTWAGGAGGRRGTKALVLSIPYGNRGGTSMGLAWPGGTRKTRGRPGPERGHVLGRGRRGSKALVRSTPYGNAGDMSVDLTWAGGTRQTRLALQGQVRAGGPPRLDCGKGTPNCGLMSGQAAPRPSYLLRLEAVQPSGWLVAENQRGGANQLAADAQALLLACARCSGFTNQQTARKGGWGAEEGAVLRAPHNAIHTERPHPAPPSST